MNLDATRSAELTTESLFALMESKLHLLSEMHAMSLQQTDMVTQHDMTSLMSLLSRKQELMGSLADVQAGLARFQDEDPESRSWSSPERRKECQANVARCDQMLKELIVMEDRSLGNGGRFAACPPPRLHHSFQTDERCWRLSQVSVAAAVCSSVVTVVHSYQQLVARAVLVIHQ